MSSDEGNSSDDDDDYENDPAKVVFYLRGLPPFPDPPDEFNHVPEPAYLTNSGPPCLIREVVIPPTRHPECPQSIWVLLEEAGILQNAGQYEGAARRFESARKFWREKWSWAALRKGLDPFEDKERRTWHNETVRREKLRYAERKSAREQRRAAARATREAADSESDEELDRVQDESDSEEEPDLQEEQEEAAPEIGEEADIEFELFIWNSIGSVYQSMNNDLKSLVCFWKAKQAHDTFLGLSDADKEKKAAAQKKAAEEAAAAYKAANDDGMDDLRDLITEKKVVTQTVVVDEEDLRLRKEKDRYRETNPLLRLDERDLAALSLKSLKPFDYASPATALTYSNLGSACYHLHRFGIAINCFWSAQQIRFQCIPEESDEYVDVASTLNNIGCCLHRMNRFKEAYGYYLSAQELLQQRLDPIHPRLNAVANNLDKCKPRHQMIDFMSEVTVLQSKVTVGKMKLRQWRVQMSEFDQMIAKYGPFKGGKGGKKGGKKKGGKKKKKK